MKTEIDVLKNESRLWLRDALSENELTLLENTADLSTKPGARLRWTPSLKKILGVQSKLTSLIQRVLPSAAPVRIVAFNKTPESNWGVPWHQDRVIAVRERVRNPHFRNWSMKNGLWHCEPPIELLERMLFVRIHLDASNEENGCLEIARGSHHFGVVPSNVAADAANRALSEVCHAARGDILVLKMLTLHRSLYAERAENRRTFRVDYSADNLPSPLQWAY